MKILYQEGDTLQEGQYFLKIIPKEHNWTKMDKGFLTKLTKTKTFPLKFVDWKYYDYTLQKAIDPDIYIFDEYYREGWKLIDHREGASQNWITILHPEGFTVEIYLNDFLDLCKSEVLINGIIQGKFKWQDHKLIKEP
jgi:hypothetical protein